MSYPWIVEGTVELCPPVPFALLRELLDQGAPLGGFEVAPHGSDESELNRPVHRARWALVPEEDADAGQDDGKDPPRAVKYLRVKDPGIEGVRRRRADPSPVGVHGRRPRIPRTPSLLG